MVLPEVLHSLRSLFCTTTNETPHERFFSFHRRFGRGNSLPSWLLSPGPVLLRRNPRSSKHDPLVDQVEHVDVNPMYANIRYLDGRESTLSVRNLARCPETASPLGEEERVNEHHVVTRPLDSPKTQDVKIFKIASDAAEPQNDSSPPADNNISPTSSPIPSLRKSTRVLRSPDRYGLS